MTVFAGVFCMSPNRRAPQALKDALSRNVSRASKCLGQWSTHDSARMFLTKWDSGAYAEPVWRAEPDGVVCTLAGDPLLTESGNRLARQQQLDRLAPADDTLQDKPFALCRGSFAFVHYSPSREELHLATDAVGLRSIYYTIQDELLVFSTALRVLESIPAVIKTLSIMGMAELSVFSFPLAERTPYEGMHVLREAQILAASPSGVAMHTYRDWHQPSASDGNHKEAAARLHAAFQDAIRLRVGDDQRVYSFLSGGMDSRAIVASLLDLNRHVEALNFSASGSQDRIYAQLFAAEAGERCKLNCLSGGIYPNFSLLAKAAKDALERQQTTNVDRPQFIWSGDGGSVGLGHVYMDEHMLELIEGGDTKAAIQHLLRFNRNILPAGVLVASARSHLPKLLFETVLSEVNRYPVKDLGRRIYLFLLINDQRRHLFKHFETIDQHGLELLTPFYDTRLLEAIVATPARWGILHRLYAQFFEELPAFALRTPWQTYPGHVPCPLPHIAGASYQWSRAPNQGKKLLLTRGKSAWAMLKAVRQAIQPPTFSLPRVGVAALVHALGLRDCSHILETLETYRRHYAIVRNDQEATRDDNDQHNSN